MPCTSKENDLNFLLFKACIIILTSSRIYSNVILFIYKVKRAILLPVYPASILSNRILPYYHQPSSWSLKEILLQGHPVEMSLLPSLVVGWVLMRVAMISTIIFKCLYLENGNLKGKDILVLPLDLKDTSSHEAATKAVVKEFGKVSSILN